VRPGRRCSRIYRCRRAASSARQTLIQAATGEPRLRDAKALARARSHGVDARLQLFPVDAHGFHLFWSFLPVGAEAMEDAGDFIQTATQPPARRQAAAQ
jgi:acetyl esterase/lipase